MQRMGAPLEHGCRLEKFASWKFLGCHLVRFFALLIFSRPLLTDARAFRHVTMQALSNLADYARRSIDGFDSIDFFAVSHQSQEAEHHCMLHFNSEPPCKVGVTR
jgi:hypothetical protein